MSEKERILFKLKLKVSKLPPVRVVKCIRKFEGQYADQMPIYGQVFEEIFNNRGHFMLQSEGENFNLSVPFEYYKEEYFGHEPKDFWSAIEKGWYEVIELKKVKDSFAFKKQSNKIAENILSKSKGQVVRWGQEWST